MDMHLQKESGGRYRVLNLNFPKDAAVIKSDGTVIETTMDDIEVEIVKKNLRDRQENFWRKKMPKYYQDKVAGYYLYFTSFCVVECMHVHASDRKLSEEGSAKLFVKSNGDTVVRIAGSLRTKSCIRFSDLSRFTILRCIRSGKNSVQTDITVNPRIELNRIQKDEASSNRRFSFARKFGRC